MGYTKGPWKWWAEDNSQVILGGDDYAGEDFVLGVTICPACRGTRSRCLSPNEANARLIAAAPELLEACEMANKKIKEAIELLSSEPDKVMCLLGRVTYKNSVVLAKAKGK